jgi:hypothetical protein
MIAPRMKSSVVSLSALSLLTLAACSSKVPVGGFEGTGGYTSGAQGGGGGGSGTGGSADGGGGSTTGEGGGPTVEIHFRSSTDPFQHTDGFSGQTPSANTSGIKSLTLYRMMGDPDPFEVFNFGQDAAEIDYAAGADTLVYTAHASNFPEGTFTIARVVHNWVKYRVDATVHYNSLNIPGEFDNLQVLSDRSLVDGTLRDAGYYEYVFDTGTMQFPTSGDNAPIPEFTGGGFSVVFENGEWAYYFPVSLPVTPDITSSYSVIFGVNMFESFRWEDQTMTDYMAGVFDVTPPASFEPVKKFGANSFSLTIE